MTRLLLLLAAAPVTALQLLATPRVAPGLARLPAVHLEDDQVPSDQLSVEQIVAAAEKAAPSAPPPQASGAPASGEPEWSVQRPPPQLAPIPNPADEGKFEIGPKFLIYVSLPALVLLGQLFFTFSRDALGDTALGPAVMDLWIP